ncbi:MAG: DinB family protein [Flavobacteriaceae bacterium]|nr:DinB family protein [Flavobacteriaceae bacterium]
MTTDQLTTKEFNPYYKVYIDKVGEKPLLKALEDGRDKTIQFFETIPEPKLEYAYAEGKWTPKELLLHLIDADRVFSIRALFFARSENANLSGFDENVFAENSNANSRSINNLIEEYKLVRNATIALFESLSEDSLKKTGKASGSLLSARAAGFIICGHEIHHVEVIQERYL